MKNSIRRKFNLTAAQSSASAINAKRENLWRTRLSNFSRLSGKHSGKLPALSASGKIFLSVLLVLLITISGAAQAGGGYDLSHNVIASGGETNSTGGTYALGGTIGQPLAGTLSAGGNYSLRGGFWAFEQLAPTAAPVSLSGRVFSGKGLGIVRRVRVVLFDTATGIERATQTNQRGFYRFDELEIGRFYIVRAESRNYLFTPDSYFLELNEDREDVDFTRYNLGLQ